MMRASLGLLALMSLVGSAYGQAPHCVQPRECEVMWNAAQKAVRMLSDMRIHLLTDSRIETYPPLRYGNIAALVTKDPTNDGGYNFNVQLECYTRSGCSDLQSSGTKFFNRWVTGSTRMLTSPFPAPAPASSASGVAQTAATE